MQNALSLNYPLQSRVLNFGKTSLMQKALLVLLGNFLLALSAKISIPLVLVPVTMQTLVVLFLGMAYGWRLGGITVAAYLIEGFAGLPVFTSAAVVTWGYLLGFLPAAMLSGFLIERGFGRYRLSVFAAGVISMLVIYACGVYGLSRYETLAFAINFGVKPFLLIDAMKVILLAATIPWFWRERTIQK